MIEIELYLLFSCHCTILIFCNLKINYGYSLPFTRLLLYRKKRLLLHHLRHDHMTSLAYTCQLNSCYLTYSSIRNYEKHLQREHSDVLSWYGHHNEKDFDRDRETGVPVYIFLDNLPEIENNFSEPNYQLILFKHCLRLKEKYVLPHATYLSIMDDTIALLTSIQKDISFALQSRNIKKHMNIDDIPALEKDSLVKIWSDLKSKEIFNKHCIEFGMVQPETVRLDDSSFQYVSILATLKQYFSHRDVLGAIAENNAIDRSRISDFT